MTARILCHLTQSPLWRLTLARQRIVQCKESYLTFVYGFFERLFLATFMALI
jgi:hypothetical protein